MREAERLAPPHLWDFLTMRDNGIDPGEALPLLQEYLEIRMEKERALIVSVDIQGETESRLLNFRRFKRFLFMHYDMNFRVEYPEAPRPVINVASQLRVRGELDSDEHLVTAGLYLLKFAFWESLANEEGYYNSLKIIKRTPAAHRRFVEIIKGQLRLHNVWSEKEVLDRAKELWGNGHAN